MGKKVKVVITRVIDVTEMGRKGGHARAAALSAEELSAQGRRAVTARWERYRAAKAAGQAPRQKRRARKKA